MKKLTILMVLIMSLLITGCAGNTPKEQEQTKPPVQTENTQTPEKVKVTLYFANENADGLVPVEREIDKPNDMIVVLIQELNNPGQLAPVLPKGTELVYHRTEGETLVLNFNQALADLQGTTGEFIAVNAIANTITELPQYKDVKLLVEGKPLTTGHAIYDQPIPRDESVIK